MSLRESVTVKLLMLMHRADKSDTWKETVFLPEPEITSIRGEYRINCGSYPLFKAYLSEKVMPIIFLEVTK